MEETAMKKVIINANVVTMDEILPSSTVWIEDGIIQKINREVASNIPSEYEVIDGQGHHLMPGMIDVHIHGANGCDMMDGTTDSILEVSRISAVTGCTSFLVTSVSSSLEDLLQMIKRVRDVMGSEKGATIEGIHLEGPYLNVKRKGMQNELYLRHPNMDEMQEILQEGDPLIKMITIAPELPGGMEMVEYLSEKDIIVAIAHSDATYEEAKEA